MTSRRPGARLCLILFLAAQFFGLTRVFFGALLGEAALFAATIATHASIVLLPVIAWGYGAADQQPGASPGARRTWIAALSAIAVAQFFHGLWLREYAIAAVAADASVYATLIAFVAAGASPRFWDDIDAPLLVLFGLALAINIAGIQNLPELTRDVFDRVGPETSSYRTQWALAMWPLLLLTARWRRWPSELLILLGVAFVLLQQVLFQKRAPTARVLVYLVIFLIVIPALLKRRHALWPATSRLRTAVSLLLCAAALGLAIAFTSAQLIAGQASALAARYAGAAQGDRTGAAAMLTTENDRVREAAFFLAELGPYEWLAGRGFGGYYTSPGAETYRWLDDVNVYGRRELHVGALMPLLKGGVILWLACFAGIAAALRSWRAASQTPLGAAAYCVVAVQTLFLLTEGGFIMSDALGLALFGACAGRCLASSPGPAPAVGRAR